MKALNKLRLTSQLIFCALLSHAAFAVDGVLEINQVCVVNTGCLAGDTAGFPVTITSPGSYLLTGNLTVPDAATTAIEITAGDVTLDLNGFTISGPTTCTGIPASCGPKSSGNGINVAGAFERITVVNGSIRGMGRHGAVLGAASRAERLHVENNAGNGILLGSGSIAIANTANLNGDNGLFVGTSSIVRGNAANSNGENGISAFFASVVSDNTANNNGGNGIATTGSSTISGNTVFSNGSFGIHASNGSLVIGNTARSNDGFGLTAGSTAIVYGYKDNVFTDNNGGDAFAQVGAGGATEIGINLCGTDTTCP